MILGVIVTYAVWSSEPPHFGWRYALPLAIASFGLVLGALWLAWSSTRDGAPRSWRWRYEPLDYVAWLLVPAVAIALCELDFGRIYDDSYITFTYAQSLASGEGFFFNAGEHVLGTTAPGYAFLLGILGLPDPDSIPDIADWVGALSLAALGLALYAHGRMRDQRVCGLLAGLLAVTSPFLISTLGGETLLLLALIGWGSAAYQADRTVLAALLLALATLVRPDGALALGAAGLHYVITRRRFPLREAAVVAAALGPALIAATIAYGTPLPNTLDAKIAQGDIGWGEPFLPQALAWLLGPDATDFLGRHPAILGSQSSEGIYVALAGVGAAAFLLRRFRFWWLPLVWAGALTLAYTALGVPFYHWYAAPLALGVAITAGTGIALILRLLWDAGRERPVAVAAAAAVAAVGAVYGFAAGMSQRLADQRASADAGPTEQYRINSRMSDWLNANTPRGSSVGYEEVGIIGFHSDNRIVDPFGLVTEGAADYIARNELDGAYRRHRPDYLLFWLFPTPTARWFTANYEHVGAVSYGARKITIYRKGPS